MGICEFVSKYNSKWSSLWGYNKFHFVKMFIMFTQFSILIIYLSSHTKYWTLIFFLKDWSCWGNTQYPAEVTEQWRVHSSWREIPFIYQSVLNDSHAPIRTSFHILYHPFGAKNSLYVLWNCVGFFFLCLFALIMVSVLLSHS